jgi:hypothetical protein
LARKNVEHFHTPHLSGSYSLKVFKILFY